MATKHFFITLIIFIGMIAFGLAGVLWVNYFDKKDESNSSFASPVAK